MTTNFQTTMVDEFLLGTQQDPRPCELFGDFCPPLADVPTCLAREAGGREGDLSFTHCRIVFALFSGVTAVQCFARFSICGCACCCLSFHHTTPARFFTQISPACRGGGARAWVFWIAPTRFFGVSLNCFLPLRVSCGGRHRRDFWIRRAVLRPACVWSGLRTVSHLTSRNWL